ncbi:hypothetical protein GCM10010326_36350 [Streptomyces xanthochromogenes]|uniref:Uncharacterized protein n=1 Tax=Streptomyces xanthochromogenes TaxID=67384 RepID=A0ABQ3AB17_9ACTN|nr:hypothetical protein GCM10010326_36350 [Streptomyces xanthochromogenes]
MSGRTGCRDGQSGHSAWPYRDGTDKVPGGRGARARGTGMRHGHPTGCRAATRWDEIAGPGRRHPRGPAARAYLRQERVKIGGTGVNAPSWRETRTAAWA